jgi:hypothetical protein
MVFVKILKGLMAVATFLIYFVIINTFLLESHSFHDTVQYSHTSPFFHSLIAFVLR